MLGLGHFFHIHDQAADYANIGRALTQAFRIYEGEICTRVRCLPHRPKQHCCGRMITGVCGHNMWIQNLSERVNMNVQLGDEDALITRLVGAYVAFGRRAQGATVEDRG